MSSHDIRVRRPDRFEVLLQQLRGGEVGFTTLKDVLLFAAGVGVTQNRRVAFEKSGEPIRYDTLTSDAWAEPFISMIAACAAIDDPEILDDTRLEQRVLVFEEYANGGLEYIQEQVNVRKQPYEVVIHTITVESLSDTQTAKPASIEDLLSSF